MTQSPDIALLLDAAERLFARSGVHGVSLREITLAAEVRSKSAVQLHFGGRDGLVRAVLARRGETLRVRRAMFYEQLVVEGIADEPRSLFRTIIEPYCQFLSDGPGALAYLIVAREVMGDPQYSYEDLTPMFGDNLVPVLLERLLAPLRLPYPIPHERSRAVISSFVGTVADRARLQLDGATPRHMSPVPVFVANILDMFESAVLAPVNPATAEAVRAHPTPPL